MITHKFFNDRVYAGDVMRTACGKTVQADKCYSCYKFINCPECRKFMKPQILLTQPHKWLTFRRKETALFVAVKLAVATMGANVQDTPTPIRVIKGVGPDDLLFSKAGQHISCEGNE